MMVDKSLFAIILIGTMFLSTFAFTFIQKPLQSFDGQQENTLPTEKIVSYLTENQRILAISNGFTIIYFNYTSLYDEVKSYLESLTSQHYIYLVENPSNKRFLKVESLRGSREIINPNINQTIELLCQIMIDRPIDCVMREVK